MNPHYKKAVDQIHLRNANLEIKYLLDDTFINKYFSEAEFNEEILTDKVQKEFDRRLKVALEEAVEALNIRRNLLLLSVPFAYFLVVFLEILLSITEFQHVKFMKVTLRYIYGGFFGWFFSYGHLALHIKFSKNLKQSETI